MSHPRVVVEVASGAIVLEVFDQLAPRAAGYFLGLVDSGVHDGTTIYRSTSLGVPGGPRLIQAGPLGAVLAPSGGGRPLSQRPQLLESFETTGDTGLRHRSGTLSLARDLLDTGFALPEFFLCLGDLPQLDEGGREEPDTCGFPAFGAVVEGLDLVAKIAARETAGATPVAMLEGQILTRPVEIRRIVRL